ncbi:MAG: nickel-dependent hydrogenase large subunit [Acidobacteriota bacterium]|nr:nickel-dependent hydrogenase large subunit [Acidobacteriota bacterium]
MDFYATVDLGARRVVDARASAAAFRGYEVVLRGRDPLDAMDLSSRACGVCGGVHSSTSSMALDMALPVSPPPLGILTRNIAQAAEFFYDHMLHMCLLAGPDYSEAVVRKTDRRLWSAAETTKAPGREVHRFETIGDLMRALNPLEGELYLATFARARVPMHIVRTMVGSYPHPSTLVPGGISVLMDEQKLRSVEADLHAMVDWIKLLIHVYDDLMHFFRQQRPEYDRVGERRANLICFGRYDDVDLYDGQFATMDQWAGARAISPGVIIDGELRTTQLSAINLGIEEFVDHAFYEKWAGDLMPADPAGNPLSPFHPWNKETIPKPEGQNWQERYTWATAPRWDREVVEAGPIARNWMIAIGGKSWGSVMQPSGDGFDFVLPPGESLPEATFHWRRPSTVNAIERNLARAYSLGITWLQCMRDTQHGITLLRRGERKVWNRSVVPERGIGVGFWEAARGALAHWITIEGRVVKNYQIVTPSSFNASPRDPWGVPGPYEEAALATPILEDISGDEAIRGIDVMRAIRSFDPCMPCAVHMYDGVRTITRDVTSCACSADE